MTLRPLLLRFGRTDDKGDERKTMTRGTRSSASDKEKGAMSSGTLRRATWDEAIVALLGWPIARVSACAREATA
jgi:hypothetical protein